MINLQSRWRTLLFTSVALVGFSTGIYAQSLLQQIESVRAEHDLMGASVLVLCNSSPIENISVGIADYSRSIPITDSTQYRIASVSKLVTAMGLMKLYDEGLFDLDDDAGSILGYPLRNPYFPNDPITPRMLLSHTSSIVDGTGYSSFLSATYGSSFPPDLSELLTSGGQYFSWDMYLQKKPGVYFNYSNINFGVIGTLIEKLSGMRFDIYMREHVLAPLGIKGSFNISDIENINNVAVLYRKVNGVWVPQADNYQGVQPEPIILPGYMPGTNGLVFGPQGGLRISAFDIAKVMLVMMDHGTYSGYPLLAPSTRNLMMDVHWQYNGFNGNNYYDLFNCWGLGTHITLQVPGQDIVLPSSARMWGHPGEAYGLVSDAYVDTLRRVGVVFITNGSGTGYNVGSASAFYTVEQDVFTIVDDYLQDQVCNFTRLEENASEPFHLFPNPTEGSVTITGRSSTSKIVIYSVTGTTVCIHNGASLSKSLEPGLYLVTGWDKDEFQLFREKLIVY